jgi:diguanylate cyclase (GGDEF)-like protein
MDRERLIDMDRRIAPVRRNALGVLAVALLILGPWLGFWTLIPLVFAAIVFGVASGRMEQSDRPEYWMFGAWVGSEVIMGAAVALSGGPTIPTMSWFAIPVVTLSARFSARGVIVGVVIALALMLVVAFGVDAHAVIDNPPLLIAPAALVIAMAMLSTALMRSDVEHRGEAVVDPLTGMLNRGALSQRVVELEKQSEISAEPIGVILGDVDDFKAVNDSLGHAVGDTVLKDVAAIVRHQLRAFDLAYRFGGDEFLILLPGADLAKSLELAELLRKEVSSARAGSGLNVTMSLGVAASQGEGRFDYSWVFSVADAALYGAKRAGGDCVRGEGEPAPATGEERERRLAERVRQPLP